MTKTRTSYIYQEADGTNSLIETAEGYCSRRRLRQSSSSIKKLQRMARIRERGFRKTVATAQQVARFGPPINVA